MGNRTKEGQKVHDQKVLERAKALQKQGYKVRADIPGFRQPDSIGGFRPDIQASKGGSTKLIEEVETLSSLPKDRAQQEAFEKHAKKKGINFNIRIAKKRT